MWIMLQSMRDNNPKIKNRLTNLLKIGAKNQAFFVFSKRNTHKAHLCCENFDKFLLNHTFSVKNILLFSVLCDIIVSIK